MYDRILVPTDGSDGTDETLDHALDLARRHGATVHTLYVVDRRRYLGADDEVQADLREELTQEGEVAVAAVAERARGEELEVVSEVREGIPYRDILAYVEEEDIDLLAMGTHDRTGRERVSHLGSVTERVMGETPVPMLVVDIGEDV